MHICGSHAVIFKTVAMVVKFVGCCWFRNHHLGSNEGFKCNSQRALGSCKPHNHPVAKQVPTLMSRQRQSLGFHNRYLTSNLKVIAVVMWWRNTGLDHTKITSWGACSLRYQPSPAVGGRKYQIRSDQGFISWTRSGDQTWTGLWSDFKWCRERKPALTTSHTRSRPQGLWVLLLFPFFFFTAPTSAPVGQQTNRFLPQTCCSPLTNSINWTL